ncbi:mucin-1 [Accipiter gentilis]|uniref:mucin-1 n=1 Tax=Astur gentilis TaxID=8957 RepID=UPI00210F94D3|nr:mucin-1 [Accipiter gentilis]
MRPTPLPHTRDWGALSFPCFLPGPGGCGSAHRAGQMLPPTSAHGCLATAPSPCPHLRLHPPVAWGYCWQRLPEPGECGGPNPGGGCCRGPLSEAAHPCPVPSGAEGPPPPSPGPVAGWGLPTCSRCSIKLLPLLSHQFLIPGLSSAPPANGRAAAAEPREAPGPPGTSPMAVTTLLLLLVLGTAPSGMCAMTTETTTETTTTDTTTTETTMETTIKTTTTPTTTTLNVTISKNTSGNRTQTSLSYTTVFPATGNTTNFQSSNSSTGNTTASSTSVPVSSSTAISHTNTTANSSNWVPHFGTDTTSNSSAVPTSATGGGTVIPTSSTKSNESSSTQVVPTWRTSVTAQGSMAPRQTPTAVLGSSSSPNPSKTTAPLPAAVQLLFHISLSFRIVNRSFNESLRDPTSKEYRSLSRTVLTMFEYVFGCASCMGGQTYKGCSELRFSQGSVEVQSTLVFGHGNDTVTSDAAEQQLRNSLDQNGFIMDLQLASIQSTVDMASPAPVPMVPDWAIALLVLVCILLLLSILTCLLITTCTCCRKSRGKLDLFSTKDSYHPMAEYPPYQSHGRYVSPNSKPNPYSQVASSNGAGAGTFTYTDPAATSDNL